MSGGSFDYLYLKDDLPKYALEQMADELDALAAEGVPGAAEAAAKTRRYIAPEHDVPIRDVWHAVEWWRSADWGKEDVLEALGAYAKQPDPTAEALARFLVNNSVSIRERPLEVARTMLDWFGKPAGIVEERCTRCEGVPHPESPPWRWHIIDGRLVCEVCVEGDKAKSL